MFKTRVKAIGEDAIFDETSILVLFGKNCPDELQDACIIHEPEINSNDDILHPGGIMRIDDNEYIIKQVGEVANENFIRMGHITLVFDPSEEVLPGSIVLSPARFPDVKIGSSIEFI